MVLGLKQIVLILRRGGELLSVMKTFSSDAGFGNVWITSRNNLEDSETSKLEDIDWIDCAP